VLAVGILALVIASVSIFCVQPLAEYLRDQTTQRGIDLRALERDRALILQKAAITAATRSVDESPRWNQFYSGADAAAATLQLQTDLRTLFQGTSSPSSVRIEPPVVKGRVTRIAMNVTLSMKVDELANALDRLQKHPRQLHLETLRVQAPESQYPGDNPMLNIQAEIVGWMATVPSSAKPAS
jgi:hypothetical protein